MNTKTSLTKSKQEQEPKVLLHLSDKGVATVTLNMAEKHNAFDEHIIALLSQTFDQLKANKQVKLMVLAARGKSFCAGADLAWMKKMATYSHQQNLDDATRLAHMLKTLNELPIPTIAKVQGAAFGGAVGLVSCCDIAIASDKAKFSLSEVKLGLIPATISPYVIRAIGEKACRRYFLTAEPFDAKQALKLGLINELVSHHELDQTVEHFGQMMLANSPHALAQAKRLIFEVANQPINSTLIDQTSQRIADIRVSKQGQEGLTAFLEKRRPNW
ncbi:enoyl-CoA hydratase/isomerase family protein [Thalassotalea aquiviva]|uniref:enoyl-CoA hydratase/isomerase family protein n=1 Tax=Thalassotalea aquiviva TaxID=3242415 RepID=UPI00352AED9C